MVGAKYLSGPLTTRSTTSRSATCQQLRHWDESLVHFKTVEAFASITVPANEVNIVTRKALRGQGYDLTELHRYDEARTACRSCLKLMQGSRNPCTS